MSAGVSERMKGQGNQGVPFQYPPFGVGDGRWSNTNENLANLSSYTPTHDNYGVDGMLSNSFGQQPTYNYFPDNGEYNAWGPQQINNSSQQQQQQSNHRKYDNYYNRDQGSYSHSANEGVKSAEQGMRGLHLDNNSSVHRDYSSKSESKDSVSASGPKKMTWATIASQPAKPTIKTNLSSSTLKKKGPGMPPPPMVPGKHNMDIGTWDSPTKNGVALVPPPVITPPIIEPSPFSQQPPPPQQQQQHQQQPQPHQQQQQQQQHHQQQHNKQGSINDHHGPPPNRSHQSQHHSNSGGGNNHGGSIRPWHNQNSNNNRSMQSQSDMIHNSGNHYQRQNSSQSHGNNMMGRYHESNTGPSHYQSSHSSVSQHQNQQQQQNHPPMIQSQNNSTTVVKPLASPGVSSNSSTAQHVLEELRDKNQYNPAELDVESATLARFFVIKSYSEDDIHRSIKYEIWCSTEHGNKRLDQAYRERESEGGLIYLLFSVNGSGHFCGMAQMVTAVDYNSNSSVWSQDKWKGTFRVRWVYVKDVPNSQLRHIRLENNDNKSVTKSRDTQEVPNAKGIQVLRIMHQFKHQTSIFDDFGHYELKQEEEEIKKHDPLDSPPPPPPPSGGGPYEGHGKPHGRGFDKGHGGDRGGYYGGGGGHGGGMKFGGGRGRGQYHNYDNRRPMDDRGPGHHGNFERNWDNGGSGYNNREGGDMYRGNRGDYRDHRRDDRPSGGYMSRDRDHHDYGSSYNDRNNDRNPGGGRGGHRDHYRDRNDQHGRGGRGGNNGGNRDSASGYRN